MLSAALRRTWLRRAASSFAPGRATEFQPLFERILGSRASVAEAVREQHGHDEGHFECSPPDLVLFPSSVEEVSATLRICNEKRIPVMAMGTGTGLEGGVNALQGGVTIDLLGLDQDPILHDEDFVVQVQPGITRKTLNEKIRHSGLFFPVDPGADASLCGMVATGASGTNAVRKTSAGYNLTELFVGSEGTLGLITEATLRLSPRPQAVAGARVPFKSVRSAVDTVVRVLQSAVPVARIEFLDDRQVKACNAHSGLTLVEQPTLFFEFHGADEAHVTSQADTVSECSVLKKKPVKRRFVRGKTPQIGRLLLRKKREKDCGPLVTMLIMRRCTGFTTDVCVPLSRLVDVVDDTRKDLDATGTMVGHVGDGNFHVILPVNEEDEKEMDIVWGFSDRRALAANGTCTGEHGIGIGKKRYLQEEVGPLGIATMKALKAALDPNGILNPGKVF